jgi:hypothetical protein
MTDKPQAHTMQDARLIETEILVPNPKRFVREALSRVPAARRRGRDTGRKVVREPHVG